MIFPPFRKLAYVGTQHSCANSKRINVELNQLANMNLTLKSTKKITPTFPQDIQVIDVNPSYVCSYFDNSKEIWKYLLLFIK